MKKIIYHGSSVIVKAPSLLKSKKNNDYGQGFYCTEDEELAKEWSCKNDDNGIVNIYELELDDLKVLDLREDKYSILNWIAILLKHRTFSLNSTLYKYYKEQFINKYYITVNEYDVVIGFRADDSYFSFANAFVSNTLPVRLLESAMYLGDLGYQIVIVSDYGISKLKYLNSFYVNHNEYNFRYVCRDLEARQIYNTLIEKELSFKEDKFIVDILRSGE